MTPDQNQPTDHQQERCTGIRLLGYGATIGGDEVRVLCGSRCSCAKGRRITDETLSRAVDVAKRRGGSWISEAELSARLMHAATIAPQCDSGGVS